MQFGFRLQFLQRRGVPFPFPQDKTQIALLRGEEFFHGMQLCKFPRNLHQPLLEGVSSI